MLVSQDELIQAAREAAANAYAPHSQFRVGAAVVAGGQIFSGCNIENASLGLTLCAERVAIFSAVAAGHRTIEALAVVCIDAPRSSPSEYQMPCGACRQVMAEFGSESFSVYVEGAGTFSLDELIPFAFQLKFQDP